MVWHLAWWKVLLLVFLVNVSNCGDLDVHADDFAVYDEEEEAPDEFGQDTSDFLSASMDDDHEEELLEEGMSLAELEDTFNDDRLIHTGLLPKGKGKMPVDLGVNTIPKAVTRDEKKTVDSVQSQEKKDSLEKQGSQTKPINTTNDTTPPDKTPTNLPSPNNTITGGTAPDAINNNATNSKIVDVKETKTATNDTTKETATTDNKDAKWNDTVPSSKAAAETKPAETKPAETKPAETKPVPPQDPPVKVTRPDVKTEEKDSPKEETDPKPPAMPKPDRENRFQKLDPFAWRDYPGDDKDVAMDREYGEPPGPYKPRHRKRPQHLPHHRPGKNLRGKDPYPNYAASGFFYDGVNKVDSRKGGYKNDAPAPKSPVKENTRTDEVYLVLSLIVVGVVLVFILSICYIRGPVEEEEYDFYDSELGYDTKDPEDEGQPYRLVKNKEPPAADYNTTQIPTDSFY